MILFNIIHPTKYLNTTAVVPEMNPTSINQFGVNGMPMVAMDIVKPVKLVENV
jgi:hypothetical protein